MSDYSFKQNGNRDDGWIKAPDGRTITTLSKKDTSLIVVSILNSELNQLQADLAAANARVSELEAENARLQEELEDSATYGEHLVSLIRGIVDTESKASDEETSIVYVMAMKMAIVPLRQETLIWQAQDDEDSKVIGIALTPPEPEARYKVADIVSYQWGASYRNGVIVDSITRNGKTVYTLADNSFINLRESDIVRKLSDARLEEDSPNVAPWLKPEKRADELNANEAED